MRWRRAGVATVVNPLVLAERKDILKWAKDTGELAAVHPRTLHDGSRCNGSTARVVGQESQLAEVITVSDGHHVNLSAALVLLRDLGSALHAEVEVVTVVVLPDNDVVGRKCHLLKRISDPGALALLQRLQQWHLLQQPLEVLPLFIGGLYHNSLERLPINTPKPRIH